MSVGEECEPILLRLLRKALTTSLKKERKRNDPAQSDYQGFHRMFLIKEFIKYMNLMIITPFGNMQGNLV